MQIDVSGDDGISPQARTYAEYRMFAALIQLACGDQVRKARVVLRRGRRARDREAITCTVTVALSGSESVRIRTRGDHAYAAINRAVERLQLGAPRETARAAPAL